MVTGEASRPTMERGGDGGEGGMEGGERAGRRRAARGPSALRAVFGHVEVLAVHADDEANSEEPAYGQGELEEHDARPARDAPGRSSPRRGSCAAR